LITLLQILEVLLDVVWWIIVVQAIMSWLLAFNVINTHNDTVRAIWLALKRLTDPLYDPIRRIMPDFGTLDLSPIVVLLIVGVLARIVIPNIAAWYIGVGTL
jgi:YggT family protein